MVAGGHDRLLRKQDRPVRATLQRTPLPLPEERQREMEPLVSPAKSSDVAFSRESHSRRLEHLDLGPSAPDCDGDHDRPPRAVAQPAERQPRLSEARDPVQLVCGHGLDGGDE